MKDEITLAEVTAAEAALIDAKKDRQKNPQRLKVASAHVASVRQAYRRQEEAAGRRQLVAGDAQKVG